MKRIISTLFLVATVFSLKANEPTDSVPLCEDSAVSSTRSLPASVDTLVIGRPYIIEGIKTTAALLNAPFEDIDTLALSSLSADAAVLSPLSSEISAISSRAATIANAIKLLSNAAGYTLSEMYESDKSAGLIDSLNSLCQTSDFTPVQIDSINRAADRIKDYETALLRFSMVAGALLEDDDIVGFMQLPGDNSPIIAESVATVTDNAVQAPRVAMIKQYPVLYDRFQQFVRSVTESDTVSCQAILDDIISRLPD